MNKIIKIALESKFPNINMEALLDVVNATGNPAIATEVLLGVYEQPTLLSISRITDTDIKEVRTLIEYDKYTDRVSFTYVRDEFITVHFKTQEEMDNTTEYDNNLTTSLYNRNKDDYPFNKRLIRKTTDKGSCTLKAWRENKRY